MCKPELSKKTAVSAAPKAMLNTSPPSGIFSIGWFEKPPPLSTLSLYCGGILAFLIAVENGLASLLDEYKVRFLSYCLSKARFCEIFVRLKSGRLLKNFRAD